MLWSALAQPVATIRGSISASLFVFLYIHQAVATRSIFGYRCRQIGDKQSRKIDFSTGVVFLH